MARHRRQPDEPARHAPLGTYRVGDEPEHAPAVRRPAPVAMRKSPLHGRRPTDAPAAPPTYRPSVLATAATAWLLLGLVLSVALHTGLGVAIADVRFTFLDPGSSPRESAPVRIKRARFDTLRTDAVGTESADALSPGQQPQLAPQTPMALDEVLALSPPPPAVIDDNPFTNLDEQRQTPDTLDAIDTGFAIDPALLATLNTKAPEPITLNPSPPASASGADASRDLTAALLAASRGSSVRSGPGVGGGGGGSLAYDAAVTSGGTSGGGGGGLGRRLNALSQEQRQTPIDAGVGIDFTALSALEATTQLAPPEPLDDDFAYALSTYSDPRRPAEPGFFRIDISAQRSLRKLPTMPKDVVFLIDTSSSIPQKWVTQIATGVEQALVSLNEGDRFNLVLFADEVGFLFDNGPQPATPGNVQLASAFLKQARSKGYTDVNAAVRRLLQRDREQGRVSSMILISDGQPTVGVVDGRELINLITRENDGSADIYCIGVGLRRNLDMRLLDFLAYRNRGFSVIADSEQQVAVAIRDLASRLRFPIITDVSVQVAGQRTSDVFPAVLPSIHQGQRFALYGRYSGEGPLTFRVTGTAAGGQRVDFTFGRDPRDAPRGADDIATGWAFWKLHHLYSEVLRLGQREDLLAQMKAIEQRFGLRSLY